MKYWSLMLLIVGLTACQGPAAPSKAAAKPPAAETSKTPAKVEKKSGHAAAQYHYSPFVVQVPESAMVFDVISFKDVGLKRESQDPADPLLESLAEAVSFEIQSASELGVKQSHVEYLESYADPANHRSCESEHLYVDVWNKGEASWGYSLWSGCGDADNFAWEEVAGVADDTTDLPDKLQPLAGAIAKRLVTAHQSKCFVKNC